MQEKPFRIWKMTLIFMKYPTVALMWQLMWLHSYWFLFLSPHHQLSCPGVLCRVICLSLAKIGKKNHWVCHEGLQDPIVIVPLRHPEGEKTVKCFDGAVHTCTISQKEGEQSEKLGSDEQQQGQWGCRCLVNTWAWLTGGAWSILNSSQTLTQRPIPHLHLLDCLHGNLI